MDEVPVSSAHGATELPPNRTRESRDHPTLEAAPIGRAIADGQLRESEHPMAEVEVDVRNPVPHKKRDDVRHVDVKATQPVKTKPRLCCRGSMPRHERDDEV